MSKLTFVLCAVICLFRPCETSADEGDDAPEDSARAPRLGVELGCAYGGFATWQRGYENGGLVLCSAGVGVLDAHGGAMLRISGGSVGGFLSDRDSSESMLNAETLLWLPHQIGANNDVYLALGPMIRWIGNSRRLDVYAGAVAEAGFDWILRPLTFVRMRYSIRSHLTYASADVVLMISATYWSLPL